MTYEPTISIKGNGFLLTGFQSWGDRGHSCSEPSFLTRPRASLAPQKATSQNHTQKFPMSLSALKLVMQTSLRPLWKVPLWVSESPSSRSSSLLQDLGRAALSLQAVAQGTMGRATRGRGGAQGGPRPKGVASPYVLQRSRSSSSLTPDHTASLFSFSLPSF